MMRLFCAKCQKVFEAEKPTGTSKVKCPKCGEEQEYPQTVPGPGVVVGDFLIEKPISSGGMGEVFLAKQISLDRPVALKVLQQKHIEDKEYVESLFKEARAAAKLSHPNIVQAYAVGEENGIFYFAMEYIRGETFKQILKREKTIDFTRAATVIRDIARAIGAAWREQKLVHQDIKPDNIMLDANGFAKLSDLGLAKVATGAPDESDDDDKVLGTPQYISPEQLTGVPTDIRSDIYSLGATFYHFVTGRFPYVAKTGDEIARMHIESTLQPPKEVNKALPDALNRIIVKMMEKDINKRYQSADELIGDLDSYLRTAPLPAAKSADKAADKPADKTAAKPAAAKAAPKLAVPKKAAVPKLAVPGRKSAAPAAAPAESAASRPAEPPPPVPSVTADVPQVPADAEADSGAGEEKSGMKRPLKIALTAAASLVLVAIILMALLVVLFKSRTLPEGGLNSFAGTIAGWFGISDGKTAAKPEKKQKPEDKASETKAPKGKASKKQTPGNGASKNDAPKKKASEVDDSAVDYDRLLALSVGDQEQKSDFYRRASELLDKGVPQGKKARASYLKLRNKFASVDEEMNFASFRADSMDRREKEERRLREKQAESERRKRDEAAKKQMEAERKRASLAKLQKDVDKAARELVAGFYKAVDGDDAAFEAAMDQADILFFRREGKNDDERKLIRDYRDFRKNLQKEVAALRNFRNLMKDLKGNVDFRFMIGNDMCQVVALLADGSVEVESSGSGRLRIAADKLAGNRDFKDNFELNFKDKNPDAWFYYHLAIRRFDRGVMNKAPDGFWKKHIGMFVRAAKTPR